MSFMSWIRGLRFVVAGSRQGQVQGRRRKVPPRARPHLEILEQRMAPALSGIGIIGNSYEVSRGGNNFPDLLSAYRGLNFGPQFSYVSGGTTIQAAVAPGGALSQLAQQVGDGEVGLAYVGASGVDFAQQYTNIYFGNYASLPGGSLAAFTDTVVNDVAQALDTLSAAGNLNLVVGNVGDFGVTPFIRLLGLNDPAGQQRYTDAARAASDRIDALAEARGIPVMDFFGWGQMVRQLETSSFPYLVVGGVAINTLGDNGQPPGRASTTIYNPTDFFVDAQHAGRVGMGTLANMFVEAIDRAYGAGVAPFTDQELLTNDGITPPSAGPTYFDVSRFVIFPTPTVTSPGSPTNDEGDTVNLPIGATVADTFSATGLPPGLSINPTTGVITGALDARAADNSPYTVTVSASVSGKTGSTTFTWTVNDTTPPDLASPGDQTSNEGDTVSLPISAVDADPGTFTATGLPNGLGIDPTTGVISGTIAAPRVGPYTVTVSAGDHGSTASTTFTWVVNDTTTTTVTASANPSTLNQAVTFTATVTPGAPVNAAPAGMVQFQVDGADVGAPVALVNGQASFTTSSLPVGPHSVTAVYSGGGNFLGSSGQTTQNVHYNFGGFLRPLAEGGTYDLGRTLPIKFQLTDANGNLITALGAVKSLQVQQVDAQGNALAPAFTPAGSGGTALRYDSTANQFVFNWDTRGLKDGGYYEIELTLADGTVQTLVVQLR